MHTFQKAVTEDEVPSVSFSWIYISNKKAVIVFLPKKLKSGQCHGMSLLLKFNFNKPFLCAMSKEIFHTVFFFFCWWAFPLVFICSDFFYNIIVSCNIYVTNFLNLLSCFVAHKIVCTRCLIMTSFFLSCWCFAGFLVIPPSVCFGI